MSVSTYSIKQDIRKYVLAIKEKFAKEMEHIDEKQLFYMSFKRKSPIQAQIYPVRNRMAVFIEACYIIEVNETHWAGMKEEDRMYVILHELMHIPDEGAFDPESKFYRRTVKHDVQDFASLLLKYGVMREKASKLLDKTTDEKETVKTN